MIRAQSYVKLRSDHLHIGYIPECNGSGRNTGFGRNMGFGRKTSEHTLPHTNVVSSLNTNLKVSAQLLVCSV